MRVEGEWRETTTTVPRPYVRAHLEAHDGTWVECLFLIDTGADCTVISHDIARLLGRPTVPAARPLQGIGGVIESLELWTTLRFAATNGTRFNIEGKYDTPAQPNDEGCILGYNVLHLFSVVIDKTGDTVCLLRPPHRYVIQRV